MENMNVMTNKVDFALVISVKNANPNGDPLNGNRPRTTFDDYGMITDVCIKRKIRNRLQDMGERIFVQSDGRSDDGFNSLEARAINCINNAGIDIKTKDKMKLTKDIANAYCREFADVRAFGTVAAFKGIESTNVRGAITIQMAESVSPVDISEMQITKSVNGCEKDSKASDTMGTKSFVNYGVYVVRGTINVNLAEKTGLTVDDVNKIKEALRTLFENDESSARPSGSMNVEKMYWWEHDGKNPKYSSARVFEQLNITLNDGLIIPTKFEDYTITLNELDDVNCEVWSNR